MVLIHKSIIVIGCDKRMLLTSSLIQERDEERPVISLRSSVYTNATFGIKSGVKQLSLLLSEDLAVFACGLIQENNQGAWTFKEDASAS